VRIVSLLPAATELVCAAGLQDRLVGRSHECDFPAAVIDRPAVTRAHLNDQAPSGVIDAEVRAWTAEGRPLYAVDGPMLRGLRPDLILTQDLCEVCAVAPAQVDSAVQSLDPYPRVLRLAPGGIEDVLRDLVRLGELAGRPEPATAAAARLRERFDRATDSRHDQATSAKPRVLFLEWLDPPFSAGHWNPELIRRAGARSVLPVTDGEKSRVIPPEALQPLTPDLIFVAACGLSPARARREWHALPAAHPLRALHRRIGARVVFADGHAHFNRPGPRLVDSLEFLREQLKRLTPPSPEEDPP